MTTKRQQYLQAMGIQVWKVREAKPTATEAASGPIAIDSLAWDAEQQTVEHCQLCELHKTRTNAVFGAGSKAADLLLIGEAPGASEDKQGEPFVGRAGMLLNAMLQAINLDREKIYITNILKCRPPNNRDPLPREVELCTPYLLQQIELLQPKLIVASGRIAAQFLLDTKLSLGQLRGKLHYYGKHKIPLLVTYHPAYLLRSPKEKAKAYEDLLKIKELLKSSHPAA